MRTELTANDLFWHDGLLQSLQIVCSKNHDEGRVTVRLSLYESETSIQRREIVIDLQGVSRIAILGDLAVLLENSFAGHVNDGYVKQYLGRYALRIHLVDGYLDLEFKNIIIKISENSALQ